MKQENQKINLLIVPITWIVAAITAVILGVCGQDWVYYLIGVFTGLLNFGIMIKSNKTMALLVEADPDHSKMAAKKHAWLGILLRMLVVIGVFLAIFFKEVYGQSDHIWILVIALGGYATVKVVLIVVYVIYFLISRKKVKEE